MAYDPPLEIIAEAGSNHNGDVGKAIELVDIAKDCGASSVKFQLIFAEGLYVPKFFTGENATALVNNDVFDVRKKEELTTDHWEKIWAHANDVGIDISASVFCEKGVELLRSLGADYVKIASTDLTNKPLVKLALQNFKRVIVSTGMSTVSEVADTLEFVGSLEYGGTLELMHCVSLYPCPLDKSNMSRINLLRQLSSVKVGYSDHTLGPESALIGLALGVNTFEKHFTLEKTLPGFDHKYASSSDELRNYIETLNAGFISIISQPNSLSKEEAVTKVRARRGVYAARDISPGEVIQHSDLIYVRPSSSEGAISLEEFVGKTANGSIPRYAAIKNSSGVEVVDSNWQSAFQYWSDEMAEKKMSNTASSE